MRTAQYALAGAAMTAAGLVLLAVLTEGVRRMRSHRAGLPEGTEADDRSCEPAQRGGAPMDDSRCQRN
jgi:hypothetical protein